MTKKRIIVKSTEKGGKDLLLEYEQMITAEEYVEKYPCRWCKGGPAQCSAVDEKTGETYYECIECIQKRAKESYEKYKSNNSSKKYGQTELPPVHLDVQA